MRTTCCCSPRAPPDSGAGVHPPIHSPRPASTIEGARRAGRERASRSPPPCLHPVCVSCLHLHAYILIAPARHPPDHPSSAARRCEKRVNFTVFRSGFQGATSGPGSRTWCTAPAGTGSTVFPHECASAARDHGLPGSENFTSTSPHSPPPEKSGPRARSVPVHPHLGSQFFTSIGSSSITGRGLGHGLARVPGDQHQVNVRSPREAPVPTVSPAARRSACSSPTWWPRRGRSARGRGPHRRPSARRQHRRALREILTTVPGRFS